MLPVPPAELLALGQLIPAVLSWLTTLSADVGAEFEDPLLEHPATETATVANISVAQERLDTFIASPVALYGGSCRECCHHPRELVRLSS